MPIVVLADSTARALRSSLVLNDASSVVKELIDNALDARATAVAVEISSDTLNVVQVKDNGSGIGIEDRQLLCKRSCTSKIRTLEDLAKLGGSSLGFRGEALASIAELTDTLSITTRIDGEKVGSTLKYGQGGVLPRQVFPLPSTLRRLTLCSSSSASHPVGTTVRLHKFLNTIPVRKQTALKAASRTLENVKRILQNHAFARPSVRFSVKVLKSKSDKANWAYGPRPGSISLADATSSILGQEVAAQCRARSASSEPADKTSPLESRYAIEAFLPRSDAQYSKVSNIGQFVSVDGRPLSPRHGTVKDIIKIYKSYCDEVFSRNDKPTSTNPFLCLHICCTPGSYDVNLEPAKDQVLFIDPTHLISLTTQLFKDHYGESQRDDIGFTSAGRTKHSTAAASTTTDSFYLLLARRHSTSNMADVEDPSLEIGFTSTNASDAADVETGDGRNTRSESQQPRLSNEDTTPSDVNGSAGLENNGTEIKAHFNMYDFDEGDVPTTSPPLVENQGYAVDSEGDVALGTVFKNPWSLAKLHSSVRPGQGRAEAVASRYSHLMTPTPDQEDSGPSTPLPTQPWTHRMSLGPSASLPTPGTSPASPPGYQNPGPPMRRAPARSKDDDEIKFTQDVSAKSMQSPRSMLIDSWVQPRPFLPEVTTFPRPSEANRMEDRLAAQSRSTFGMHRGTIEYPPSPRSTHVDAASAADIRINGVDRPFKSPFKRKRALVESPEADRSMTRPLTAIDFPTQQLITRPSSCLYPLPDPSMLTDSEDTVPICPPIQTISKASQSSCPDLAQILDFEHRKKAVNLQCRAQAKFKAQRGPNSAEPEKVQPESSLMSSPNFQKKPTGDSEPAPSTLDHREEAHHATRAFEDRFGSQRARVEDIQNERPGPHRNRYLTAKKRLFQSQQENRTSPGEVEDRFKFSEDDPRAYFIRHQNETSFSTNGMTKTGLRIRRTKIARLPLETIPFNSAVQNIQAKASHPFPTVQAIAEELERLARFDEYAQCGGNCFSWFPTTQNLSFWERRIQELITQNFVARIGTEEIAPNIDLELGKKFKVHVDSVS